MQVPVWAVLLDPFMTIACSRRNCSIRELKWREWGKSTISAACMECEDYQVNDSLTCCISPAGRLSSAAPGCVRCMPPFYENRFPIRTMWKKTGCNQIHSRVNSQTQQWTSTELRIMIFTLWFDTRSFVTFLLHLFEHNSWYLLSRPSMYSFFFFLLSWADCLLRIFRRIFFRILSSYLITGGKQKHWATKTTGCALLLWCNCQLTVPW